MASAIRGSTGERSSSIASMHHLTGEIHSMKDHAASVVSDDAFAKRKETFPVDTPDTKEAYFIREIFQGKAHAPHYVTTII